MAWGDLASNQMVSYTDAQTSGFALNAGQSSVTSNQCMTKSDAFTKYNLAATSNTDGLASNQLMRKSFWAGNGNAFAFGTAGSTTSSGSCGLSNTGLTLYSADTTLVVGSKLFYDSALTNRFAIIETGTPWWHSGSKSYRIEDYYPNTYTFDPQIREIVDCVAPSVVFNNTYYWSYTSFGQSASGTVTITGSSATFYARGVVINSGSAVLTNITINGISRSVTRFSTPGTSDSTGFTLSPGTYSYSASVSLPQAGAIGGGIYWTQ